MHLVKKNGATVAVSASQDQFDQAWDLASEMFWEVDIEQEDGDLMFKSSRATTHRTMPSSSNLNRDLYDTIDSVSMVDLSEEEVDIDGAADEAVSEIELTEAEKRKIESILSTDIGKKIIAVVEETTGIQRHIDREIEMAREAEEAIELFEAIFGDPDE